ncbi:MAG: hypothetical protein ACRD2I_10015 [Vicinamibacterales bacterium]
MSDQLAFSAIVRLLAEDSTYRRTLVEQAAARTIDQETLRQLIAYARTRQTTLGQAMARKVLTDAGVSWEAP